MVSLVLAVPQRFSPLAVLQQRTILVVLSAWLRRAGCPMSHSEAMQTALLMELALPMSPREALQTELALPISPREQLQTVLPKGLLSTVP